MTVIDRFLNFNDYVVKMMDKYQIPGIGIGMNRDGNRIYEKGFGFRDKEEEISVTSDTVFGIASITKSFTCVAIMQLQEAGKLSVHDKVVTYLPEFRIPNSDKGNQMTIHHFMTNSSGLPPLGSAREAMEKDPQVVIESHKDFMEFIHQMDFELLGEPGTEFSYSNHAFGLLGAIIERVSGQPYEKYVKEHILMPAGMVNSAIYLSELHGHEDITKLYEAKQVNGVTSTYALPKWVDLTSPSAAAGSLKSSVNDMLKYAEIFRNEGQVGSNRILTPESVCQMTHPHIKIVPDKYYGYGLMITPDYYGSTLVEHGGAMDGVASQLCVVPEKGLSSIILINLYGAPSEPMLMSALNEVQDKQVNNSHLNYKTYRLNENDLKKYVGTYVSDEGAEVIVDLYGEGLTFNRSGAYQPIRSIGNHLFAVKGGEQEGLVRFILNDNGEVIRLLAGLRQLRKKYS